jgi:hypothetical protein
MLYLPGPRSFHLPMTVGRMTAEHGKVRIAMPDAGLYAAGPG